MVSKQSYMKQIAILGTTPDLSALELESLNVLKKWSGGNIAELSNDVDINILGGTIKICTVVDEISRDLAGLDIFKKYLTGENKIRFGFSVYAGENAMTDNIVKHYAKKLERIGIDWKKEVRATGKSIRYVSSKEPALSSVIVQKEHLLDNQTDFCLVLYNKSILLARTTSVQPFRDFSKRDYGRPQRDHHSGMLPPKIARMMINISQPNLDDTILDPFCGSGTILQEALLSGYKNVIGSDISKKSILDTTDNLAWLNLPKIPLHVSDVKDIKNILGKESINRVVAEGYLGPLRPKKTDKVHRQMIKLYEETFLALTDILAPQARIVLAVPAWRRHDDTLTLPLAKYYTKLNYSQFHEPIFYSRPEARVVRKILFLTYQG
ncbi:MAG: DNA methyltransferase [bacterium]|nr:DNA methyltransferase [bacterium]